MPTIRDTKEKLSRLDDYMKQVSVQQNPIDKMRIAKQSAAISSDILSDLLLHIVDTRSEFRLMLDAKGNLHDGGA